MRVSMARAVSPAARREEGAVFPVGEGGGAFLRGGGGEGAAEGGLFAGDDMAFFGPGGVFLEGEFEVEEDFAGVVGGVVDAGDFDVLFLLGGELDGEGAAVAGGLAVDEDGGGGGVFAEVGEEGGVAEAEDGLAFVGGDEFEKAEVLVGFVDFGSLGGGGRGRG